MAQNVMVCCRFRPANKNERADGAESVVSIDSSAGAVRLLTDPASLLPSPDDIEANKSSFNFDAAFDWTSSQQQVFDKTAKPLVQDVFAGYNTTIFAYGQTGSGKTHTMMGNTKTDVDKGIIPRLVESIFQGIEESDDAIEFTVKLSYVEIYNEKIRDLLNPRSSDNLKIREAQRGGIYIEGVTETYVNSYDSVLSFMQQGQDNRAVAATNMNEHSSRSHSVFILTLGQLDKNTGSKKGAKLTLVDLAGSEKVGKTGAVGQTLDEAKHINKSLSALGNVINALTSAGAHIPYRDSKLTRLLSDSLGGNSKTCLIITCSPMSTNLEETISTLRFGTRAKRIKNKPKINAEKSVAEYKELLAKAQQKILAQRKIIEALDNDVENLYAALAGIDPKYYVVPMPILISRDEGEEQDGYDDHKPTSSSSHQHQAQTPQESKEEKKDQEDQDEEDEQEQDHDQGATQTQTQATDEKESQNNATSASSTKTDDANTQADNATVDVSSFDSPRKTDSNTNDVEAEVDLNASLASPDIVRPHSVSPHSNHPHHSHSNVAGLGQLLMKNSELENRLKELQSEKVNLEESITEKEKELEDEKENFETEKKSLLEQLQTETAARKQAEEKSKSASEIMTEYNMLKSKVSLVEKEKALEITQLKHELRDAQAHISQLQAQCERLSSTAVSEMSVPSSPIRNVNSAASVPNSPDNDVQRARALSKHRLSMPPQMGSSSSLLSNNNSSNSALDDHHVKNKEKDEHSIHLETLTTALQRKCDQYIQLQMAHQNQNEHIATLEMALDESNARLKDAQDSSSKKIRELEDKLSAAETLCGKLIESGRFFRQDRKQQKTTTKIAMPLVGGQHHQTPTTQTKSGGVFSGLFGRSSSSSVSASSSSSSSSSIANYGSTPISPTSTSTSTSTSTASSTSNSTVTSPGPSVQVQSKKKDGMDMFF